MPSTALRVGTAAVDLERRGPVRTRRRGDGSVRRGARSTRVVKIDCRGREEPGVTVSGWPYPSYADRRWLGGERGSDRSLAAVVRAVRAVTAEAGEPQTGDVEGLSAALGHLAELAERVDWALLSVVGEARTAGMSWQVIGAALGVSKQAAQQRFARYVAEALEQAGTTA
jgi:hypothetical protein